MKKAQMEVLGLAFVVLLIILGLMFIMVFEVNEPESNPSTDFLFKQLSSNMINSIIHATTKNCNNNKIEDLMRDCAKGNTVVCGDGKDSCTYVHDALVGIFSQTIDVWVPTGYMFTITSKYGSQNPIIHDSIITPNAAGVPCSKDVTGENSVFPIPLDPDYLYVNIYLCK